MRAVGCVVEQCSDPHYAFGMCSKHYRRWRRHGTVDLAKRPRGTCVELDCDEKAVGRELCMRHYQRRRRALLREKQRLAAFRA